MKNLLLILVMTVSLPVWGNSAYPDFEIFEYDFEKALYRAEAENNLLFCTLKPHKTDFHNVDCFEAIKHALELDLSYKTIIFKLVLKNTQYPNQNIALLNKEVDLAVKKIDPRLPIDDLVQQIIQSALSISKK